MNELNQISLSLQVDSLSQVIALMNTLDQHKIKILKIENYPTPEIPTINDNNKLQKSYFFNKKKLGQQGYKILELLAQGYTYDKIAKELNITINGVRYYIKKIFKALNVDNGRDAVRIYLTDMKGTV